MNNSFLTAAASYYGLSPDNVAYSDWSNDNGEMMITFAVRPTDDDVLGILSRMKAMREEEAQRQRDETESNQWSHKDVEQCRAEYNAMSAAQKSTFGSYSRYQAYRMMGNDCPAPGGYREGAQRVIDAISPSGSPLTSNADDFGGLPG